MLLVLLALLPGLAFAADPTLLPLTADPRVGDHVGRLDLTGAGGTLGGVGAAFHAEVALASRLAIGAAGGYAAGIDGGVVGEGAPLATVEVRAEILDPASAPVGLGAGVAWQQKGFDGLDAEVEATVAATLAAGPGTVYANLRGGHDVGEPEGDVEGSAAATFPVGAWLRLGGDARGRIAVGDAEELEREAGREGEERRGWDVRGGAVLTVGGERVSGYLFGGVEAAGDRESTAVGPAAALGIQLLL